jgi:hypothetical protein
VLIASGFAVPKRGRTAVLSLGRGTGLSGAQFLCIQPTQRSVTFAM